MSRIVFVLLFGLMIIFSGCNRDDISSPDKMLLTGAKTGNIELVQLAIAKGAYLNTTDEKGGTALHWAVYYNHKEVVEFLLMQGADPTVKDKNGITTVDLARIGRKKDILKTFEKYMKK